MHAARFCDNTSHADITHDRAQGSQISYVEFCGHFLQHDYSRNSGPQALSVRYMSGVDAGVLEIEREQAEYTRPYFLRAVLTISVARAHTTRNM